MLKPSKDAATRWDWHGRCGDGLTCMFESAAFVR